MGITAARPEQYAAAIRTLFPQGEYWDRQFADGESDCSLFCKAKTSELINLRTRMAALLSEGDYETATEMMDDWERVLLADANAKLPIPERREILRSKQIQNVNRAVLEKIAQDYGLTISDIVFPFRPAFFGFSRFGISVFSRPVFFSVFYIAVTFQDADLIAEAQGRINTMRNAASFGRGRFGVSRFLKFSYFIKDFASEIFNGMDGLSEFEDSIRRRLLSSNIVYFLYKV
jgi:uncharacterized protein YmfQ (DUF2313 family)